MYSMMLMAAMTAGPETPSSGGIGWDTSLCFLKTHCMPYCTPVKACFYDTCLPARYGWAQPAGCCGAYRYGGCYGVQYGSCFGGHHGFNGCGGCGGGCWGGYRTGCGGCHGGCYSMPTGCTGCHGYACNGYSCNGCIGSCDPTLQGVGYVGGAYGNFGAYGTAPVMAPVAPLNLPPATVINPAPARGEISIPRPTAVANITLEVPENAVVFIDGNRMNSTSAKRTFTTPELEVGMEYEYTVRVLFEKNGQTVEEKKQVVVRPGKRSELAIGNANPSVITGIGR